MFAPQEAVSSKKVFEKEIYNSYLSESYQKQGESPETRFTTEFNYPEVEVNASTKDANIGLKKIYGLIGSGSASASEALLGGLMPYTNVVFFQPIRIDPASIPPSHITIFIL